MNPKILIVEDEAAIRKGLVDTFMAMGFQVESAKTGVEAVEMAKSFKPDLMILDVMMPCFDGFEVCRRLKERNFPIVMLTAKNTDISKVTGFELGIEDYVTKPFSVIELVARVKAILKRRESRDLSNVVSLGRALFNFDNFEVRVAGKSQELTPKCFELLAYLIKYTGKAVRRSDMLDEVWGMETEINTRTIDNHIVKLRQLIEVDPKHPRILHTVHGIGYKLVLG